MVCHNCFNEIGSAANCPTCGSSAQTSAVPYVHSQAVKRRFAIRRRALRLVVTGLAVVIVGIAGLGAYSHSNVVSLLNQAKAHNAAFKYEEALTKLEDASGRFALSSVKNELQKLKSQTSSWSAYAKSIVLSDEAMQKGAYAEAASLLEKMPEDFPQPEEVTKRQQAIIAAEQEQVRLAQEKAAAEKAAADKAAADAAKKARPRTPALVASNGKKFADTSAKNAVNAASSIAGVEQALTSFLAQYGAVAKTTNMPQSIYGGNTTWAYLDGSDLAMFKTLANNFIDEWAKYPPDFVKSTGLESVNFVKHVTVAGQQRTAMPGHTADRRMWYGTGAGPAIVHHEFAHYFEAIFFGVFDWGKDEWIKYNPPGFTYGAGGATAYGAAPKYAQYEHPISGFVTEYGTYGIEEDRAELFSYLMYKPYYVKLKTWLATDTLLQGKVTIYKNMLQSKNATMSGSYFDDINR